MILYELKRVALGEFMDDLDIGGKVMETIGLEPNEVKSTDEMVGEDRLGPKSPVQSFGATLLIATMFSLSLLFLILIVLFVIKRTKLSNRCRNCANKHKKLVLYNPIIRYLILNALKLNMAGLVALKTIPDKPKDLMVAILIVILLNGAPVIFYFSVKRNRAQLE